VTRQAKLEAIAREPARFVEYIEFGLRHWLSCAAKEVVDDMTSSTAPELRELFSRAPKSKLREFRNKLERELGGDAQSIRANKDRFVMTTSTSGSALQMFKQTLAELAPLADLDALQRYLDSHERYGARWRPTELELPEAPSSKSESRSDRRGPDDASSPAKRELPARQRRHERPKQPQDSPVELYPVENHATVVEPAEDPIPPGARMLAKLMAVVAVDETDPEVSADEILAAAAFNAPDGTTHGGEPFLVGEFDDGDRVDFYPRKVLYRGRIHPEFPQLHAGVFSLVEQDSDDASDSVMKSVGSMAGLLTLVGMISGSVSTLALIAAVSLALGWILQEWFKDDVFTPKIDTYEIRGPGQLRETQRIGGKTFGPCSIRQLEWKEHGATYRLIYYWQLVHDAVSSDDPF
jgi:hypothetical protein